MILKIIEFLLLLIFIIVIYNNIVYLNDVFKRVIENQIEDIIISDYDAPTSNFDNLDFKSDFNNNILPQIDSIIVDVLLVDFNNHIRGPKYRYEPADRYWRNNKDKFLNTVINTIPEDMFVFFSKYMTPTELRNFICRTAAKRALDAMAVKVVELEEEEEEKKEHSS